MKPALDNEMPQVFNPILSLEGICRSHDIGSAESVTILDQLTLEAHSGTLTVIRGESGSGKTSLLRIIGLLDQDFSGRYEMLGKRVDGQPDWYLDDLRAANIGFIFQEGRLFSHLTLRQNIDFPARIFLHENFEERTERINTLAQHHFRPDELAGGVLDNTPARVSGGQRQRAAILRALPASPCIILADEPTASLHGDLKREIVRMLEELQQAGHCVIVVSHDDVFYGIGRQLILHEGKIHEISYIN
jgi:ABC-type lipoprotein export system ATPase subunit